MLVLLLALQVGAARVTPAASASDTAERAIRARVDSAIRSFQTVWRDAWAETRGQVQRYAGYDNPFEERMRYLALHCHWIETNARLKQHVITGTIPSHGTCPIWYPVDGPKIRDERHGIDGALTFTRRWRVRSLRRPLRSLLDSAATALPGDARIAAQRVRFAVDDDDVDGAVHAAAACDSNDGYCAMLRGLVLHRAGRTVAADSAFRHALTLTPEAERCAWSDVTVLLEPELRQRYLSGTCAERAAFESWFWWLSDPLWSEPGNERRAEQFARKVMVTVLAPLLADERQHWAPEKGGEAVAESLLRYGWPTQFYWAGFVVDDGHDTWLLRRAVVDTAQPYVVREYSRDRLHTVPTTKALASPFDAAASDWTLNGLVSDEDWWPREHFGRDAGMIQQLREGQLGMLRRWATTNLAWATELDSAMRLRSGRDSVRAALYDARGPEATRLVGWFGARSGRPLVVSGSVSPGPTLLGVELPGDARRTAARTRFGVTVVPSLRELGRELAISQPLLIAAPDVAAGPLTAEAAVPRMLGSTTITRAQRLGIYWEAYGFAVTDTVDIRLTLSREGKPGIFERVTTGFGLWGEEGGRADVRWTEPPGGARVITQMEGNVPVQMRSVSLDLRRQRGGRYKLEVSMKTPTGTAVTGARLITLR